jgi:hypothetical protein
MPRGPDIPPAAERFPSPLCTDGIDNDGNGRCDHAEPACSSSSGQVDPGNKQLPPGIVAVSPDPNTCRNAVDGRIAWDYNGSKSWAAPNLARLCRGAETTREPARCFEHVMHGGINLGKGTIWTWQNALALCAGTLDADRTTQCFEKQIGAGTQTSRAIDACSRE